MNKFNFIYDFKHEPTHRIEYDYHYCSVSSPGIFKTDEEAIQAAKKYAESDVKVISVISYKPYRTIFEQKVNNEQQ